MTEAADQFDRLEAQLETMLLIREFEERVSELFEANEIPGFVHLYIGQEAVAAGACSALEDGDYITSTHRGHGHALAKGLDPDRMMAELFAKASGYSGGKGGSMHIAAVEKGMLGANGIVGAGTGLAIGAGRSIKLQDQDKVCISLFGEGAMAEGMVHEAMNMAAVDDLPVIFLCENNGYGEMTAADEQHHVDGFVERGDVYDMPSEQLDGMDVEAVYEGTTEAVKRARAGDGPSLLICDTYRYHGHYEGDPMVYRSDDEVDEWRERDPIERFTQRLLDSDVTSEAVIEELEDDVETVVDEAVEFARESSDPDPESAYEDVYTEVLK
jgi:pyruvate dehydrogenase E1 component alpha subunit